MPFVANTPESLVARSDSKNPATTCRGITSAGRPCRRPLAAADADAVAAKARKRHGTSGRKRQHVDDPADERLYCWQHKDQAAVSSQASPGPKTSGNPGLGPRTSIDTLADRLGLLDVNAPSNGTGQPWPAPRPQKRKQKHYLWLCCFRIPLDNDALSTPPPRPRPQQPPMAMASRPPVTPQSNNYNSSSSSASGNGKKPQHLQAHQSPSSQKKHHKRKSSASATSQTGQYLSLIPPSASPQTASTLMAELAKPISHLDEAGYIYMFWLTPESEPSTPTDAARSLLSPSPQSPDDWQRRGSDVFASFAAAATTSTRSTGNSNNNNSNKTILLKIGRANNVQRRLNEWKRQCGYNLSLIRYYPYVSSSGSPGGGSGVQGGALPRKMPHSHKVERLIHLELAGAGLRIADAEKCEVCGREHREWFQVEATRNAVIQVDETIRRWTDWDESQA